MVRVAVAGGTGAVGKTIVEVLLKSQKHDVFILTRKLPSEESSLPDLTYLVADYVDVDATTKTLEDNAIDTIISAISIESEDTSKAQISLIAAAERSKTITRFIPSEYGFIASPEIVEINDFFQYWIDNTEALKTTNLKYTRIANGFFMDYWGIPHLKSHLKPFPWAIVVDKKVAAIPGSGDDVLSMTYSFDLAEFIVRMLDTEEWPEISAISGQDVTFNQLMTWAEEARGSKFDVKYDSEEILKQGKATILLKTARDEMVQSLTSLFGRLTIHGHFKLPENDRRSGTFPDLNLKRVDDMIKDVWSGR